MKFNLNKLRTRRVYFGNKRTDTPDIDAEEARQIREMYENLLEEVSALVNRVDLRKLTTDEVQTINTHLAYCRTLLDMVEKNNK